MIDKVVLWNEERKGSRSWQHNDRTHSVCSYVHSSYFMWLCLISCSVWFLCRMRLGRVTYPLLKENGYKPCYDCDSFRGITLSAVISKDLWALHNYYISFRTTCVASSQLVIQEGSSCRMLFSVLAKLSIRMLEVVTCQSVHYDILKRSIKWIITVLLSQLIGNRVCLELVELLHMRVWQKYFCC